MKNFLEEKISNILNKTTGLKAVLFDDEMKSIISNLIPHSKFLEHDFFYFDSILNNRNKIDGVICYVFIKPKNIKLLIEEITNPTFDSYVVMFSNTVDPLMLEILAKNDSYSVISEVFEVYLDFLKEDENLFVSNVEDDSKRIDSLYSFILSCNINPTIYYMNEDNASKNIGYLLEKRLSTTNLSYGGTLLILDRGFDLITPLLYDWRYFSMINEFCDYKNQIASCSNKTYLLDNDDFFIENKFNNIEDVSENIKDLAKTVENKVKYKKLEFTDIEKNTKLTDTVEKHLNLHKQIINDCIRIQGSSENIYYALQTKQYNVLKDFILNNNLTHDEKIITAIFYCILRKKDTKNFIDSLPDCKKYIDDFFEKFKNQYSISKYYTYEFEHGKDIKLAYVPPIQRIVKHLYLHKINTKYFNVVKDKPRKNKAIIFYFKNGVTIMEYKYVLEFFKTKALEDINVFILGDFLLTTKKFIR